MYIKRGNTESICRTSKFDNLRGKKYYQYTKCSLNIRHDHHSRTGKDN